MIDLSKNVNTDTYNNTCRVIENGVKSVTKKGYKTPKISTLEFNKKAFWSTGDRNKKKK